MSQSLDSIDIGDPEYLFDEKIIGDAPNVDASQFVDRATFEHEVALHQQAIRRAEQAEAELTLQREAMQRIVIEIFGKPLEDDEYTSIEEMCAWIRGLRAENTKIKDDRDVALARAEELALIYLTHN